jgi:RHS repeat-associated protein
MSCAPAGLPGQCVRRRRMVLSRRCAQSTIRGAASQAHRARSCVACRRASPSVRRNPRKPNPSGQVGPLINRQRNSLSRARARAKIASREKFALYAQSASKNLRQVLERTRENRLAYDKRTSGGRFLSIDPVTTEANSGGSFNRYAYANNSPYQYIDPDGRFAFLLPLVPYVATATVAIVGHYVLPGRQGREDTARAVGNAILNSGSGDKGNNSQAGSSSGGNSGAKIEEGKQGKHVPGHNNFEPGKSELTHPNPQSLVDEHKGTGQQVGSTPVGEAGSRERVDFGTNIGVYVDPATGQRSPTTNGMIHESKKGVHIVPARPNDESK